jgi:hypothetical protein
MKGAALAGTSVGIARTLRVSWARRRPWLLLRLSAVFLLRFAARTFLGLLFQEPPRTAIRPAPWSEPDPECSRRKPTDEQSGTAERRRG